MRHYSPKQRTDGKWEFTCGGHPTGYCATWSQWDCEKLHIPEDHPSVEKHKKFKDKHHTCGHETELEARECYKEFLLDHDLYFSETSNTQHKCEVCKKWTSKFASLSMSMHFLCEEHCNRETVEQVYKAPQQIWIS